MDGQFYLVASAPLRVGTSARQARANDDVTSDVERNERHRSGGRKLIGKRRCAHSINRMLDTPTIPRIEDTSSFDRKTVQNCRIEGKVVIFEGLASVVGLQNTGN